MAGPTRAPSEPVTPAILAKKVQEAYDKLKDRLVRTSTIPLPWLGQQDEQPQVEIHAKLEGHQHTGSFKYRGALNAVSLSKADAFVTASAGNHALALCAAAKAIGKKAHIIIPIGVTEIKAKRIMASATSVSFAGNDLYSATLVAKERVAKSHGTEEYISPYAAVDVAAGAGTMMVEATEDAGHFDYVIVPLGGGGLASGVAAWSSIHSPRTKVIAVQPAVFSRQWTNKDGKSRKVSDVLFDQTVPSLCDGLGVQLTDRTPLAEIIDSEIDDVVLVSEDEVTLAMAEALRFQSLVLEGSAAAAIAAYHKVAKTLSGRVLLLLTGANVAPAAVARALAYDVTAEDVRRSMGLRNIFNPADRHKAPANGSKVKLDPIVRTDSAIASPIEERTIDETLAQPLDVVKLLVQRLQSSLQAQELLDQSRRALSEQLKLRIDPWCTDAANDLFLRTQVLAAALEHDISEGKLPYWVAEERYRLVLQLHSASRSLFERASPSYDQAVTEWFADTASQNSAMVNYDRYGALQLRAAEDKMLDTVRPTERQGVELSLLLASSGMAAFQMVLHYVLQRLRASDTIVLPPYIYFEGSEQLVSFSKTGAFKIRYTDDYDARNIIAAAEEVNAKVVFFDPLANVAGLPTTNVRDFAQTVSAKPGWESRIVVIDGTMVSGGLPVYDWFVGPHAPLVLYSESASKYTQLGLDLQMGGLVVVPSSIEADVRKIRRDVGAVMYARSLSLLPHLDFDTYQARLTMLTQNSEKLAELLTASIDPAVATIAYPKTWKEWGWRHGGAVVTIDFVDRGLNNREGLDACLQLILSRAQTQDLPITKGVSFGFSNARVSASSSMAEGSDPFLRISVGVEREHVPVLAEVVRDSVASYVKTFAGASQG